MRWMMTGLSAQHNSPVDVKSIWNFFFPSNSLLCLHIWINTFEQSLFFKKNSFFEASTRYATVQLIVGFGVQTYSRKSNRAYYSENIFRRGMWWAWVFECFGSHEHSSFCIAWMRRHPHYDVCTKCSSTRSINIHVFCSPENKGHLVSAQYMEHNVDWEGPSSFKQKHNDEIQWLSCYCCHGWWWSAPPVHCTQQNEAERNKNGWKDKWHTSKRKSLWPNRCHHHQCWKSKQK